MTNAEDGAAVRNASLAQLQAELVMRTHPYVTVEAAPRSSGYLVSWIGTPTVEEMRTHVGQVLDEVGSMLDPADAAYKRKKLDLQELEAEAMRLCKGMSKHAKAELREDLRLRLRRHLEHGGVGEVMGFMKEIRETLAHRNR